MTGSQRVNQLEVFLDKKPDAPTPPPPLGLTSPPPISSSAASLPDPRPPRAAFPLTFAGEIQAI